MNRSPQRSLATGLLLFLTACATPSTRPPEVSPRAIAIEEANQRRFVVEELEQSQRRLDDIGFPLLVAATPFCAERITRRIGVRAGTVADYAEELAEAVSASLSLTDTLTILGVARGSPAHEAGLASGDRIMRAAGRPVPRGRGAAGALMEAVTNSTSETLRLEVTRGGRSLTVDATPVRICDYGLVVTAGGDINAYADGDRVIVPWAMMRFATDDDLTAIVGHEVAHNAMGHIEARKKNMLLGGLLGAALDIAAGADVNSNQSATASFMGMAAEAYSQDFEREADYVGAYIAARAGHSLEGTPLFWRRFASVNPSAISYAGSHPTTAERFVRLQRIIEEIQAKLRAGEELLPETARP